MFSASPTCFANLVKRNGLMPHVSSIARATLGALLLFSSITITGCTLFEEVLPPGAIGDNNAPNNANNQTLTCDNAACQIEGTWRCQADSRQHCTMSPEQGCTLWVEQQRCAQSTQDLSQRQPIPNAATTASNSVLIGTTRVFARDQELISLTGQSISRKTIAEGAISKLVANADTILALTTDHKALRFDASLVLQETYPTPPGALSSALTQAPTGDLYWAQGNRVRALRGGLDVQLSQGEQLRFIGFGLEAQQERLYLATNKAIIKLNATNGQILTQSEPLTGAPLAMLVENGGVWVLTQRDLLRFEGDDFSQPASTYQDALCGTGIDLGLADGALWMTDAAGCLSRFDLATKQLDPTTIDLNNRAGGPASTNYRPQAPVILDGVGYALARTTEVVAFDPRTMQEFKRTISPTGEPLGGVELTEQDTLLLQGKTQGATLATLCPCP